MNKAGKHFAKLEEQTQKGKYYMISLQCEIEKSQTRGTREEKGGCRGLGGEEMRCWSKDTNVQL